MPNKATQAQIKYITSLLNKLGYETSEYDDLDSLSSLKASELIDELKAEWEG